MIAKPPIPGPFMLAWPFIRRFTERVFAEDRMAVEAEQRAWDEQGEDRNQEVFPLIRDVRDVLRANGVPIRPESALCGAAAFCGNAMLNGAAPTPVGATQADPDRAADAQSAHSSAVRSIASAIACMPLSFGCRWSPPSKVGNSLSPSYGLPSARSKSPPRRTAAARRSVDILSDRLPAGPHSDQPLNGSTARPPHRSRRGARAAICR